jgi:hypothetical protein
MMVPLQGFPDYILGFVGHGKVTKTDYEEAIAPTLTGALEKHGRIRLYFETGADFAGIDRDAIWEDVSLGLEAFTHWERIAVVTDVEWIKQATRFFSFLMPCPMRVFPVSEAVQGKIWILAGSKIGVPPVARPH